MIVPQTADIGSSLQQVNLIGAPPGSAPAQQPLVAGTQVTRSGQAVVDQSVGVGVGSHVSINGHPFTVVGVTSGRTLLGGTPNMYVDLRDAQRTVYQGADLINAVVVTGTPATVPAGLAVLTNDEVEQSSLDQMATAVASINNTKFFMWAVAAVIVVSLVYVTALERTRDFAVLKALGASSGSLYVGLAFQAVLVALIAAAIGAGLSQLMVGVFSQPVDVPISAYIVLPVSAVVVGLLASRSPCGAPWAPIPPRRSQVEGEDMSELEVRDLTMEFDSGGYRVRPLDKLCLDAEDGELVVLLGPSGCGKTTLLSCLAGLLRPTSGSVNFQGIDVGQLSGTALSSYRQHTVGVVFQAFNLLASLSARRNVMVPMTLAGVGSHEAGRRADELLDRVALSERSSHRPGQMSGGQQQRVAIARALVHDPPLVVADEPTAHLDHIQVEGILVLLRELATPGRMVVVSTHDDRITHIADRVVELSPEFSDAGKADEEVRLPAGTVLFEQGDRGSLVYAVEEGSIEIYRTRSDGSTEVLAEVGPGRYFGEIGPMLNLPQRLGPCRRGRRAHGHVHPLVPLAFPADRRRSPECHLLSPGSPGAGVRAARG